MNSVVRPTFTDSAPVIPPRPPSLFVSGPGSPSVLCPISLPRSRVLLCVSGAFVIDRRGAFTVPALKPVSDGSGTCWPQRWSTVLCHSRRNLPGSWYRGRVGRVLGIWSVMQGNAGPLVQRAGPHRPVCRGYSDGVTFRVPAASLRTSRLVWSSGAHAGSCWCCPRAGAGGTVFQARPCPPAGGPWRDSPREPLLPRSQAGEGLSGGGRRGFPDSLLRELCQPHSLARIFQQKRARGASQARASPPRCSTGPRRPLPRGGPRCPWTRRWPGHLPVPCERQRLWVAAKPSTDTF